MEARGLHGRVEVTLQLILPLQGRGEQVRATHQGRSLLLKLHDVALCSVLLDGFVNVVMIGVQEG